MWLYFRFTLSYRDVEELLAARGIIVTDEAIRQWCLKFGQDFANAFSPPTAGSTICSVPVVIGWLLTTIGPLAPERLILGSR